MELIFCYNKYLCYICAANYNVDMGYIRLTTEQFIEKARNTHGDEYDYSKVDFKNMNTKVCIIHKKCGNEFWQTPKNHLRGQGFPFCKSEKIIAKLTKSREDYVNEANIVHNFKYDYSKLNYIKASGKVCIVCPEHGEFWQVASSHLQGCGCPKCANEENGVRRKYSTEEFINKAKLVHKDR